MSEDSQFPIPDSLRYAMEKVRHESLAWLHKQQEVKQDTAEYISDITAAASKQLRAEALPKVLELTVGQQELVSIRRVDIATLKIDTPDARDGEEIFNKYSKVHISSQWLQNEGDVGIIVSPQIFRAEPTTQADVDFLNEETGYDDSDGWSDGCKLQHFIDSGGEFDISKWNFDRAPLSIRVVVRKNSRFFTTEFFIPAKHRTTNQPIEGLKQIYPDENGMLAVPVHTAFWSEEDAKAQEAVDKKFGKFYSAVVGNADKEQQNEPLKKLVPDFEELPVRK